VDRDEDVAGRLLPGVVAAVTSAIVFFAFFAFVLLPTLVVFAEQKVVSRVEELAAVAMALGGSALWLSAAVSQWIAHWLARTSEQRRLDALRWERFRGGLLANYFERLSADEYAAYERESEWFGIAFLITATFVVPLGILLGRLELLVAPVAVLVLGLLTIWIKVSRHAQ